MTTLERPVRGHPGRGLEEWIVRWFPSTFARFYRLQAHFVMQSFYRVVAEEIAASLSEGRVLDIGTGPGLMPQELARVAPHLNVTGIDVSPAMISLAHRKVHRPEHSGHPVFLAADVAHLPFPDDTFDLAVSTLSLHHWPYQAKGLASVHRVLKTGGSAWIYEPQRQTEHSDFQDLVSVTPFETWSYRERVVKFGFVNIRLSIVQLIKEA